MIADAIDLAIGRACVRLADFFRDRYRADRRRQISRRAWIWLVDCAIAAGGRRFDRNFDRQARARK